MLLSNVKKLSVVLVAAAALTLTAGSPAWARSGNRYAVTAIANPTANVRITYSFQWGDREWKTFTLEPGEVRYHYWTYDFTDQNRSPVPRVKFHTGINADRYFQTYRLEAYATPYQDRYAKKYRFVRVNTRVGDFLDLESEN